METYDIESFFLDYANLNFDELLARDKRREFEEKLDSLSSIAEPSLLDQLKYALIKPHDLVANEGIAALQELERADSRDFLVTPTAKTGERAEQTAAARIVFHSQRHQRQIVDAAYGYRDGYCENACTDRTLRGNIIGIDRFDGTDRLKCYECDHQFIKIILSRIANGDSFTHIEGFERLLAGQLDFLKSEIEISDNAINEHLVLIDADFILSAQHGFPDTQRQFQYRNLVTAFVSFSLRKFLLKNDRRKLKQCPYCGEFFIAPKVDRVRCYKDQCKREYHKRDMQKRREVHPLYGQRMY